MYWTTSGMRGSRAFGESTTTSCISRRRLPPNDALVADDGHREKPLVANPINRYSVSDSIGTRAEMPTVPSTFHIQNTARWVMNPTGCQRPLGKFILWLRVYVPVKSFSTENQCSTNRQNEMISSMQHLLHSVESV